MHLAGAEGVLTLCVYCPAADRTAAYLGGLAAPQAERDPTNTRHQCLKLCCRKFCCALSVNCVYALGEMCGQRSRTERVSQAFARKTDGLLEKLYLHSENLTYQTTKFIRIAQSMIRGAALTAEAREILLKLRDKDD